MKIVRTQHLEQRMLSRGIAWHEIEEALANVLITNSTPKDSTCIVGRTNAGRELKIWIVGTDYPPANGKYILKSAAGRNEDD